jgi:hypothetical protein
MDKNLCHYTRAELRIIVLPRRTQQTPSGFADTWYAFPYFQENMS